MGKKNDNKVFAKIFTLIKDLVDILSADNEFFIDVEITTTNSIKNIIKINSNTTYQIKISKNLIMIDKLALCLDDIVKLKILNTNISNQVRDTLIAEIENIIMNDINQEYKNYRGNNILSKDRNIERYIQENKDNIRTISFDGIKRETIVTSMGVNIEGSNVITSIKEKKEKVINNIDIDEKFVLTNNSNEVEVAKPVEIETIDVLTDIHIDDRNVVTNQSTTEVVKDVKDNKSEAIIEVKPIYEENLICNINNNIHLIKPKTIDILFIEPSNKNINKEEVKDRYLTFDPTGENYIGVVLDDGTFEPLKVSMETITVVPNDVKNILVNIDEDKNIANHIIKDINCSKNKFINSLDIEYKNNVLEYDKNNEVSIKDMITKSNKNINNVLNKDETVSVVTKKGLESIKGIQNIDYDLVSKIDKIYKTDVVKSIKLEESKNYITDDAKRNKSVDCLDSNIEIMNQNMVLPFEEDINGSIKLVGAGVMVVNNYDSAITIYSTSKISTII